MNNHKAQELKMIEEKEISVDDAKLIPDKNNFGKIKNVKHAFIRFGKCSERKWDICEIFQSCRNVKSALKLYLIHCESEESSLIKCSSENNQFWSQANTFCCTLGKSGLVLIDSSLVATTLAFLFDLYTITMVGVGNQNAPIFDPKMCLNQLNVNKFGSDIIVLIHCESFVNLKLDRIKYLIPIISNVVSRYMNKKIKKVYIFWKLIVIAKILKNKKNNKKCQKLYLQMVEELHVPKGTKMRSEKKMIKWFSYSTCLKTMILSVNVSSALEFLIPFCKVRRASLLAKENDVGLDGRKNKHSALKTVMLLRKSFLNVLKLDVPDHIKNLDVDTAVENERNRDQNYDNIDSNTLSNQDIDEDSSTHSIEPTPVSTSDESSFDKDSMSDSDLEIVEVHSSIDSCSVPNLGDDSYSDIDEASGSDDDLVPVDENKTMFTEEETAISEKKFKNVKQMELGKKFQEKLEAHLKTSKIIHEEQNIIQSKLFNEVESISEINETSRSNYNLPDFTSKLYKKNVAKTNLEYFNDDQDTDNEDLSIVYTNIAEDFSNNEIKAVCPIEKERDISQSKKNDGNMIKKLHKSPVENVIIATADELEVIYNKTDSQNKCQNVEETTLKVKKCDGPELSEILESDISKCFPVKQNSLKEPNTVSPSKSMNTLLNDKSVRKQSPNLKEKIISNGSCVISISKSIDQKVLKYDSNTSSPVIEKVKIFNDSLPCQSPSNHDESSGSKLHLELEIVSDDDCVTEVLIKEKNKSVNLETENISNMLGTGKIITLSNGLDFAKIPVFVVEDEMREEIEELPSSCTKTVNSLVSDSEALNDKCLSTKKQKSPMNNNFIVPDKISQNLHVTSPVKQKDVSDHISKDSMDPEYELSGKTSHNISFEKESVDDSISKLLINAASKSLFSKSSVNAPQIDICSETSTVIITTPEKVSPILKRSSSSSKKRKNNFETSVIVSAKSDELSPTSSSASPNLSGKLTKKSKTTESPIVTPPLIRRISIPLSHLSQNSILQSELNENTPKKTNCTISDKSEVETTNVAAIATPTRRSTRRSSIISVIKEEHAAAVSIIDSPTRRSSRKSISTIVEKKEAFASPARRRGRTSISSVNEKKEDFESPAKRVEKLSISSISEDTDENSSMITNPSIATIVEDEVLVASPVRRGRRTSTSSATVPLTPVRRSRRISGLGCSTDGK